MNDIRSSLRLKLKTEQDNGELSEQIPSSIKNLINKYSGRLLIRNEIEVNDEKLNALIKQRFIIKIKAIEKSFFNYICNRCGNQKQSLFGKIPCLPCEKQTVYCRKCINMGQVLGCHYLYYPKYDSVTWPKLTSPCTWNGELNVHQLKAAHKLVNNKRKSRDTLVWSVTGSGKTEMIFPVITEALQSGKRICIATPRKDVVQELLPRCQKAFKHVPIQALYGGSKKMEMVSQFLISTTHQLIRFKHAFDVMIIDEVDAFPYHTDKSLAYVTERSRKKQGVTFYLTATPRQIQKWQMRFKQLDYIFVPSRYHGHPLPIPTLSYSMNLTTALKRKQLPSVFLHWLTNRTHPQRQLLIFVPTRKQTTDLLPHLVKTLIKKSVIPSSEYVTSVHAEDMDREEKVELFRQKKLTVLITTTILERGVTFPSIDVVILQACHKNFDEAALIQMAGRAGRSKSDPTGEVIFVHEGKTNALINAKQAVIEMNKRAAQLRRAGDHDDMFMV